MSSKSCSGDVVATWDVPLSNRIHKIEFEHGTTSGKRVIWVDGKEIFRKDWQFKLVGSESFLLPDAKTKCDIVIQASNGFNYSYSLMVNGKQLKKFKETHGKMVKTWIFIKNCQDFRIVLEKDSLDVYVNGRKIETESGFADEGTCMSFKLDEGIESTAYIRTISSGNKREGIVHCLIIDDEEIPESLEP